MAKKIIGILALGITIRLILAFFTFHLDLRAFQWGGYIFASGNILNLYDFPNTLGDKKYLEVAVLNYPPAIYFFHGVFNFIYSFLGLSFVNQFLFDKLAFSDNPLFNLHLLFLKLPYLIFDIPLAFLLMRFFGSPRQKILIFIFWIFNPINLYATYMMGQFDIIPTFFVVLSLVFALRKKYELSALSLGLGSAFKIYPLFLLIPLILQGKNMLDRIKLLLLGLLPYLLFILPFLPSKGFRSTALVANQTLKSFYAGIPISGGEAILLFPLFLILGYLFFYFRKASDDFLWQRYFIILLIFFIFTHTHPQWFLWLTPFFVIEMVYSKFKNIVPVVLSVLSFLGLLFFFDPSLTIGLFGPISASLYGSAGIWQMLNKNLDINFLRSILQTIFVASALYLIYYYIPKKNLHE